MPEGREIPSLLCSLKGISLPLSDLEQKKTKPEGYSAMSAPRSSYKSKIVNHAVLNRDRGCNRTVITADEVA